jgi:hypothetical protein
VLIKTAEAVDVGESVGSGVGVGIGSTAVLEAVGNGTVVETSGASDPTVVGSWERVAAWLGDGRGRQPARSMNPKTMNNIANATRKSRCLSWKMFIISIIKSQQIAPITQINKSAWEC